MAKHHVSRRDQQTALLWGVSERQAMALREKLNSLAPSIEQGYAKHRAEWEMLVQWLFTGSEAMLSVSPFLTRLAVVGRQEDLQQWKDFTEWHCEVVIKYYWHQLTNAVTMAGTSLQVTMGIVTTMEQEVKRHQIVLRVFRECLTENKKLRRFTTDEQNDFLHG